MKFIFTDLHYSARDNILGKIIGPWALAHMIMKMQPGDTPMCVATSSTQIITKTPNDVV